MGLPLMQNLHAPTIPSGPTSSPSANGNVGQRSFAELQRAKNDLEAELSTLGGVLDSHQVTMETPLITRDGFPRSDIDVAQVRTTRARIIRLRNDYKEVMDKIEKNVHEQFAAMQDNDSTLAPMTLAPMMRDAEPETLEEAFAKVNTVASGSPAESAGLKPGDLIRRFGHVNRSNHDNLKSLGGVVQRNEGHDVFIKISRAATAQTQELRLTLVPRRDWGGRGMLGCHILPL